MKTRLALKFAAALLLLSTINSQLSTLHAQGTAFTYQGRLFSGANPASGTYNLEFALYNAAIGGTQAGSTVTTNGVIVTNGLFTVTIDFGSQFTGTPYWLQVGVETNGGSTFAALAPLQQVTPAPYAIYAESAGTTALLNDAGTQNFFAGPTAGSTPDEGIQNTGEGYGALGALGSFLIGSDNTANGYAALSLDGQGAQNTANGANALAANSSGNNNSANGFNALAGNTSGGGNTANGVDALLKNNGYNNTANGVNALQNNTVGAVNVADGGQALYNNISGFLNTAIGWQADYTSTAGSNNVAIGAGAMQDSASDYDLVAVGSQALQYDTGVSSIIGTGANTAIGYQALQFNTSGSWNTAVGFIALRQNTNGNNNTAIGLGALGANTSGNNNVATGASALSVNTSGINNVATGSGSLQNNTASANTADGGYALQDNLGGGGNTATGYNALNASQSGNNNVADGTGTLQDSPTGYQNTAAGGFALQHLEAGDNNVALGYNAGNTLTNGNYDIYIGNGGHANESGIIRIGQAGMQNQTFIAGTNVGINMGNPTTALDVGGEFIAVEGLGGVRCYLGDDGAGNDVQLGSLVNGVTTVTLYNEASQANMALTCSSITITGGSDLAEPFPVSLKDHKLVAGTVMVIDEQNPGHLKMSDRSYDPRVAGVVSGANGIHPGIQMQQQGLLEGGRNVALSGRVYVLADASNGAIKPGDLLTTSSNPGRAMKVSNHARAEGAILGKAMTGLGKGDGMVLVLVTLQ